MHEYLTKWLRLLFWLTICLSVISCGGPSRNSLEQQEITRAVWPKPPAEARIEFVRTFSTPGDLGIEPGIWSRIVSIFAGKQSMRMIRPTSVVMTDEEVLFVADPGAKAVHRFDLRGKKHVLMKINKQTSFASPISLAIGPENRIYVTDSALNQIYVLDNQHDFATLFKTDIPLDQPTGLTYDSIRKRLYVINTRQHQVLVFDQQGEFLFSIGSRGTGNGEFNYPTQIWSDPSTGNLWVTDSLNFRIQLISPEGQFISALASVGDATGNLPRPKGIATDSFGHVYVLDALLNTLQIFNQQGELLLYLGEQGKGIGQFWLPVGIYIDRGNRIFVADSFNNRVQEFRYLEKKG